jgi:hypothetical protein
MRFAVTIETAGERRCALPSLKRDKPTAAEQPAVTDRRYRRASGARGATALPTVHYPYGYHKVLYFP